MAKKEPGEFWKKHIQSGNRLNKLPHERYCILCKGYGYMEWNQEMCVRCKGSGKEPQRDAR